MQTVNEALCSCNEHDRAELLSPLLPLIGLSKGSMQTGCSELPPTSIHEYRSGLHHVKRHLLRRDAHTHERELRICTEQLLPSSLHPLDSMDCYPECILCA
jgi:hypothetical protein